MDKLRFVCDLCYWGKSGTFCIKGGVYQCFKKDRYQLFMPISENVEKECGFCNAEVYYIPADTTELGEDRFAEMKKRYCPMCGRRLEGEQDG